MNRIRLLSVVATIATVLLLAGWTAAGNPAQSDATQTPAQATTAQQKQLDRLKQLEDQLQKDRAAVHEAIDKHGWDSDQTDAAQEQLFRDRAEYRQLRRALRAAGVAVPAPKGMGHGRMGRAGRRGAHEGKMGRGMCQCPCSAM